MVTRSSGGHSAGPCTHSRGAWRPGRKRAQLARGQAPARNPPLTQGLTPTIALQIGKAPARFPRGRCTPHLGPGTVGLEEHRLLVAAPGKGGDGAVTGSRPQVRPAGTPPPTGRPASHFWHGWSSVRGNVGSWDTSAMIWVSSLRAGRGVGSVIRPREPHPCGTRPRAPALPLTPLRA